MIYDSLRYKVSENKHCTILVSSSETSWANPTAGWANHHSQLDQLVQPQNQLGQPD